MIFENKNWKENIMQCLPYFLKVFFFFFFFLIHFVYAQRWRHTRLNFQNGRKVFLIGIKISTFLAFFFLTSFWFLTQFNSYISIYTM